MTWFLLSYAQELDALLKLCIQCDVERLGGRWQLMLSLSKLWSEDSKWHQWRHNNKTDMWKRSIWLLHHWAEGALNKMNAEVLATKLTLTCQINSISNERAREGERERWGGSSSSLSFFDKCHLMVTKTAERETVACCWGQITDSVSSHLKCVSHCQSCWYTDCPYIYHTNTHRDTHPLGATLPPHCFERYVNETVAVSWHNINYQIKIEWVINCPSLPVLITLAEKGHFRGVKERRERKEGMKLYQTKTE